MKLKRSFFTILLAVLIVFFSSNVRATSDKVIVVESNAIKLYVEGKEIDVVNLDFFDKNSEVATDIIKESELALIEYLNRAKSWDAQTKMYIFAIGDFRELPEKSKSALINKVFIETDGLKINIIPLNLEDLIFKDFAYVFRTVVICGSFRKHIDDIDSLKRLLESKGVSVLAPVSTKPVNPGADFVFFEGEETTPPLELETLFLDKLRECDAVIVCCPEGYVGTSASWK